MLVTKDSLKFSLLTKVGSFFSQILLNLMTQKDIAKLTNIISFQGTLK